MSRRWRVVYATVYDMMYAPETYSGKTVRATGPYYSGTSEDGSTRYHFVVIEDATACCSQGLEFVWADGSHAYPDEYPAEGTEATVTGRFELYQEGDASYAHLAEASLVTHPEA